MKKAFLTIFVVLLVPAILCAQENSSNTSSIWDLFRKSTSTRITTFRATKSTNVPDATRVAGAPIPMDAADSRRVNDDIFVNPAKKWITQQISDVYLAEIQDKPWRKEIEPAVRNYEKYLGFAWESKIFENRNFNPKQLRLLKNLAEKNPDDAWLQFISLSANMFSAEWWWYNADFTKKLSVALDKISTDDAFVGRRLVALTMTRIIHNRNDFHDDAKMGELWRDFFETLDLSVRQGAFDGDAEREVLLLTLDVFYDTSREKDSNLYSALPEEFFARHGDKFPSWFRNASLGALEVNRAWKSRGKEWAHRVTKKGWKGFSEHLAKAREHLVKAWEENPDNPFAASRMIAVVMGGGGLEGDSERLWFDRAVKAQFDWSSAYYGYIWALRPRWCGSHEEMLAFGRACLATKRFDTPVPLYLERVADDIVSETKDALRFYRESGAAKDLVVLNKGLLAEPSRKKERNEILKKLVYYAWAAEDYAEARKALEELKYFTNKDPKDIAKRLRVIDQAVFSEVNVMTELGGDAYKLGQEFYRQRLFPKAASLFAEAEEKSTSERAKKWCRVMKASAEATQELATNKIVDLAKPEFHDVWFNANPRHGNGYPTSEGDVLVASVVTNDLAAGLTMVKQPRQNFEIFARFEQTPDWNGTQNLGVFLRPLDHTGERDWNKWDNFCFETWPNKGGRGGIFAENHWRPNDSGVPFKRHPVAEFRVMVVDGVAAVWLNGQQLETAKDIRSRANDWGNAVMGTNVRTKPKNKVRLLEYTVRILPAEVTFPEGTKFEEQKTK